MSASDFGWFTTWVAQHLGVCLTFARSLSWTQIVAGFDVQPHDVVEVLLAEASSDPSRPLLRVGALDGWAYTVEHLTTRGADP